MAPLRLACIVEGHGETRSIGILARRLVPDCLVLQPLRVKRQAVVKEKQLENAVEFSARKLRGTGAILVLLDSDRDLPCELGPRLLARCLQVRPDIPCRVVLARHEFESWFLASLESLRGLRGIPSDAVAPDEPEAVQDAKSFLARLMGRPYSSVNDQPALASQMDLELAGQRSQSFQKFVRDLKTL